MSSSHSTVSPQSSPASSPEPVTPRPQPNEDPAPLTAAPTTPLTLANVLAHVRSSPGWIGNSGALTQDTEWVEDSRSGTRFLRIKSDVVATDLPVDESGNVVVCYVGQVSTNGSAVAADAGFKPFYRDPARHKRIVRAIRPPSNMSPDVVPIWDMQVRGAKLIVERSRRADNGSEHKVGYCWLDEDSSFKARSALFQKHGSPWEGDTPEGLQYSTWNIPAEIRTIFDGVRFNHHTPRVLEAYDELDRLIHPNDVPARLIGAVVYVTCTLEKILFKGAKYPNGNQWQLYANIIKVRIVAPDRPTSSGASSSKRKFSEVESGDSPDIQSKRPLTAV
ncbi:hypothetical protein FRC08_009819 [Ceratobasidium sp. 394]|nr:hypothetical protein FRC08_009819 [Ceratobasidium sp. 394]